LVPADRSAGHPPELIAETGLHIAHGSPYASQPAALPALTLAEVAPILPADRHGLVTAGHWRGGFMLSSGFVADRQDRYHQSG
jgi:hypothetical protein